MLLAEVFWDMQHIAFESDSYILKEGRCGESACVLHMSWT